MANIPTFRITGEGSGNKGQRREDIYPGLEVDIILKKDQRSGKRTRGIVKDLLTSASFHSRGIKVRLEDGQVGRVAEIIGD
ncbi:YwbE family protein [Mucilaginibacter limnophilus]|uniref:YwbE family protein n=1 Tax=Mucilaginibacter limnophilus TaxID=1932778 RepID=A0A3S2V5Q8_9SPHI|nr:YwbE family protein [Mucilaginibacter limnophilus]RVT96547.1 YwbE family protein [Mucilaginibacter limnophilus]